MFVAGSAVYGADDPGKAIEALRVTARDAMRRACGRAVQISEAEEAAMHRALALAATVRGRTSPNPPVGAVILRPDGTLAGEGATDAGGRTRMPRWSR